MSDIKTWEEVRDWSHAERLAYIKTIPARHIFPTLEGWERTAKVEALMSVIDLFAQAVPPPPEEPKPTKPLDGMAFPGDGRDGYTGEVDG